MKSLLQMLKRDITL